MDITGDKTSRFSTRLQQYGMLAWYNLYSPKLTGVLVAIIAGMVLLRLLIPQQPTPRSDASIWIASLPPLLQLWGEPLYILGFARVFESAWFWLPVALLLLNSLIALAVYGPGSWQRLRKNVPPIIWQHPLAGRVEQVTRLPKAPAEFLTTLQSSVGEQKFYIYGPLERGVGPIGAARRRWAWLGVLAIYGGLILLVAAVLGSHYYLQTERITLFPAQTKATQLFDGEFEFIYSGPNQQKPWILFWPDGPEPSPLAFSGRLYQPAWLNKVVILPIASDPILVVEARSAPNSRLKLIPVQEDLAPAERLNLPMPEAGTPLYFLIPSVELSVQILADPDSPHNEYNVQVRHGSAKTPSENLMVQAGETFWIDEVRLTISSDRNLKLWTYYDLALPLHIAGGLLVIAGLLMTFVPFLRPVQLWLVPEVKGLGGQLYGVVETFGSMEKTTELLARLLALETTSPGNDDSLNKPDLE